MEMVTFVFLAISPGFMAISHRNWTSSIYIVVFHLANCGDDSLSSEPQQGSQEMLHGTGHDTPGLS